VATVTMRDVAQKAHVSIKTVSRVVNDQGEISEKTRQRVLVAIEELGYRPSKVAQALVTQRTDTVGLIVGDVVNRVFDKHPGMGLVATDIHGGARLAVDYLVGKGHTAIGMLAGRAAPLDKMQRVQGFREALMAHGLVPVDEWILTGSPILERGYEAARQLLTQHPQVTAFFAYNDLLALGAIQACDELGRRVPDDCAVVGFDDVQLYTVISPKIGEAI
jgi:DNA-binding LacI/PurR family transcriptional regulator